MKKEMTERFLEFAAIIVKIPFKRKSGIDENHR